MSIFILNQFRRKQFHHFASSKWLLTLQSFKPNSKSPLNAATHQHFIFNKVVQIKFTSSLFQQKSESLNNLHPNLVVVALLNHIS